MNKNETVVGAQEKIDNKQNRRGADKAKSKATTDTSSIPKKRVDYFLEFYQASIPFLVSLVWPLTIALILTIFKEPLYKTLEEVPSIVSNSSAIEIAGVAIQVDRNIPGINDPELKSALANTNSRALRILIDLGESGRVTSSESLSELDKEALLNLEANGLIELDMSYDYPKNPELDVHYLPTELGKKAYNFLLDIIFGQFSVIFPEEK
jgi:hypothetical protein